MESENHVGMMVTCGGEYFTQDTFQNKMCRSPPYNQTCVISHTRTTERYEMRLRIIYPAAAAERWISSRSIKFPIFVHDIMDALLLGDIHPPAVIIP